MRRSKVGSTWFRFILLTLGLSLIAVSAVQMLWPSSEIADSAAPPPPPVVEVTELATPSARPSTAKPIAIKQSQPIQMYQPDTDLNLRVLVLPAEYRDPIKPPTLQEAYWDPQPVKTKKPFKSYGLGTSTPDLAVIAGHTWNQRNDVALNPLYDWRKSRPGITKGDELWVKTKASGKRWLVYKLVKFYQPDKTGSDSLARNREIWGTDSKPRPDHLLVIGCKQKPTPGERSTANIVFDFVFDRVDTR